MNGFECIVTSVDGGYSDYVVDASKEAGAKGATIINGRGSTAKEGENFYKLNIQPDKQIVLILCKKSKTKAIVESISKKAGMNTKAHALSFVLPVEEASGMAEIFKNNEVSE